MCSIFASCDLSDLPPPSPLAHTPCDTSSEPRSIRETAIILLGGHQRPPPPLLPACALRQLDKNPQSATSRRRNATARLRGTRIALERLRWWRLSAERGAALAHSFAGAAEFGTLRYGLSSPMSFICVLSSLLLISCFSSRHPRPPTSTAFKSTLLSVVSRRSHLPFPLHQHCRYPHTHTHEKPDLI